jgi:hypothetical protein
MSDSRVQKYRAGSGVCPVGRTRLAGQVENRDRDDGTGARAGSIVSGGEVGQLSRDRLPLEREGPELILEDLDAKRRARPCEEERSEIPGQRKRAGTVTVVVGLVDDRGEHVPNDGRSRPTRAVPSGPRLAIHSFAVGRTFKSANDGTGAGAG